MSFDFFQRWELSYHFCTICILVKSFRVQEEDEPTTTIAPRRRFPEPAQQQQQKTVVNHKQSYETISRKNTDYTKQSTIATLTEDELDDDNVIALPTEPITENLPPPENILTTSTRVTTTLSPIQVNSLVQSELSSELLTTTESEFEATTTLTNDFSDSSKLSESAKQTDEILSLIDISPRTESPRPFSRPFVSRTRAPPAIRNGGDDVSTTSTTVTASSRRRPSRVSTTRSSSTSSSASSDDSDETLSPRRTYSNAGGRGTARYRTKQTKSGDYDHVANRYEPIDDNRVRAINFDRANRINSVEKTSTTQAASSSSSSKRRPLVSRTQTTIKTTTPSSDEDDDESTTEEQRVIEQHSRFALKPNERPERISFTLGTGSRIEFNTPKLDQRNDTAAAKSKIITGPLASSLLADSTRDFKKGHVEEIPLAAKTNISVESHSDKLDLGEIPLNKSDIASFVPSEALTTSTPRVRLRPSKGGFAKSYSTAGSTDESDESSTSSAATTESPEEDDEDIDTTTSRFRVRPSKIGTTKAPIESIDESSTQRTRFPPRSRITVEQTRNEIDELSTISRRTTPTLPRFTRPNRPSTESEVATTRSRNAAIRLIGRNRVSQPTNSLDDSAIEESTTRKARVKITRINRLQATAADVNNLASDEEVKKSQIRPQAKVRPSIRITTEEPNDNDANTENPFDGDDDETTQSSFDEIDDELTTLDTPVDVTAVEKPRKLPAKKVESFATRQASTESTDDDGTKAPKTTRRVVVTRRRPAVSTKDPAEESDVPKKTTTRRRVIARTRPRPQTTENTEQTANTTESSNTDASTKGRRVVTGRTRVFKRPVSTSTEKSEIEEEKPKFVQLKKLVKVNKKSKTPKALGDQELTEDDFILKPEDLDQDIQNYNDEVQDEKVDEVEDSVDVAPAVEDESLPSPRPGTRISTRPNAAARVTIKRRPIINIRQQTTLHPASTRTVKDSQSTRAKTVTIRRKFGSTGSTDGDVTPRKFTTLKTKKVYGVRRVSTSSTTAPPNITPYNTETTDYEEVDDTTNISPIDSSNDDDVNSQKSSSTRPRISLRVKGTRSTTMTPPTTLHHVFAILEEANRNKSIDAENNASEVVKRTQKLIEISRIVEVYSKQDKLKLQKNNKLKTVKSTSLVVEKAPVLENFGEISRQTVIKVASSATSHNVTTHPETSTTSPEGVTSQVPASVNELLTTSSIVRAPVAQLRPESNETKPIVISLESLDRVVLQKTSDDDDLTTSTVSYEDVTDLDEK